jgi:flagellar assembly factor FliW
VPEFASSQFGVLRFRPEHVIEFPCGLPAFEDEREFLAIEEPSQAPLVFLQSLRSAELAFLTLPVDCVEPNYRLEISEEDLEALGWPAGHTPRPGEEMHCLVMVTVGADRKATANLMAPVVVNRGTGRAVQAIQTGGVYSHVHPLGQAAREEQC